MCVRSCARRSTPRARVSPSAAARQAASPSGAPSRNARSCSLRSSTGSAGRIRCATVAEQNGYGEEPEWGAISEPAGYRALKEIDSYQAVQDGVAYPAVLLTTGVTDPRVGPFHVAKMTARLQGGEQLTQARPAARRLRRRPRCRLDPRAAGPRGGRYLRVPAVADRGEGLPARLSGAAFLPDPDRAAGLAARPSRARPQRSALATRRIAHEGGDTKRT